MGYILLRYHANPLPYDMRLSSAAFALGEGPIRGGLSHIGFHAVAMSCASSRHSILRLWRGPSPRAYARGIISHALLYRCSELCLFEALYPAPLARPFSKGLLTGIISHRLSCRYDELYLFEALYPAPLARPFSKGLRAGDYLIWAFMLLRRIVPLRGTLSCAFGATPLQGPTRGGLSHMGFYAAAANCASSRHSILRPWRGPSPRAYSQEEYSSP